MIDLYTKIWETNHNDHEDGLINRTLYNTTEFIIVEAAIHRK